MERTPVKTDLIIGMTLAEIFLLLLFVVWYSQGAGSGPEWKKIAESRQLEVASLKAALSKAQQDVAKLERIREFWRSNFGVDPPASAAELADFGRTPAGKKFGEELARGYPKCEDNNVLTDVSMLDGAVNLTVTTSARFSAWSRNAAVNIPRQGQVLTDRQEIAAFLRSVALFYESARIAQSNCRFDYRLRYATDHDYHEGRQTFEVLFYPASIVEVHSIARAGTVTTNH
jgi:hypothetical protein